VTVGIVVSILISGLFTGALARLALPGPDPMPLWTTLAIGLAGSIAGAVVGDAISNGNGYVVSFLSLGIAIALVAVYRKYVLKRPVWGAGGRNAQLRYYRGLERVRLDAMLQELHRAGIIDDDELAAKRERLRMRESDT
jgi:uncharacterized membrane protein YeaQ/YmgE (transglycosylase-associated protein family)